MFKLDIYKISSRLFELYIYLTIILGGRAGYEMIYIINEARSAELVMIISYPASPSRIIVLLKTLRHIIENLKKKSERKERSFRENRKKEIIFRSNAINTVFKNFTWMYKPKKACFKTSTLWANLIKMKTHFQFILMNWNIKLPKIVRNSILEG